MQAIKKLMPVEYLSCHMVAQNRMIVDYTFWQVTGSKGALRHYIGHTLKVQMETNGKCCFSREYFQYNLN